MTRPQPSWRSLMFVPVLSERFLAKAHERGADAIILDLEDSILPTRKADARAALSAAVHASPRRAPTSWCASTGRLTLPSPTSRHRHAGRRGADAAEVWGPSLSGCCRAGE